MRKAKEQLSPEIQAQKKRYYWRGIAIAFTLLFTMYFIQSLKEMYGNPPENNATQKKSTVSQD
jgi:hypothetical protein